jgi:hypothetical protein
MAEDNDLESLGSIEEAETFLGGLRSELDEGSHLHPTFAAMSAAADSVRASYLSYAITPTKAAEAFRLLRLVDDNDIEWTVGPSSGSWYRRRLGSTGWQPGPAPLMAEPKIGSTAPWLTSELADLLPSARSVAAAERTAEQSGKPGIRVVDASDIPMVDEGESRDWLLSEWDELEVHLDVMRQQAQALLPEPEPEPPIEFARTQSADPAEDLGLPANPQDDEEPLDMLDLFVPPEPRRGAVDLDDILGRGPSPRIEAHPAQPSSGDVADLLPEIPSPDDDVVPSDLEPVSHDLDAQTLAVGPVLGHQDARRDAETIVGADVDGAVVSEGANLDPDIGSETPPLPSPGSDAAPVDTSENPADDPAGDPYGLSR